MPLLPVENVMMVRPLLLLVLFPTCALFQGYPRPTHASPEEASQFQFPVDVPAEGRQIIKGARLRAVQLAMDDFLPWDHRPPPDATPLEACLFRREAYDVIVAPGEEGVVYVSITANPDACGGPPILDAGATYAVDTRTWRILAIQR